MSEPQPVFLCGATASGKSTVAIALAERIGGEIISVDSMAVYRGMNIGTAKPSAEERARVPHHLLDVVDVTEPFDAAKFVETARLAEADIRSRDRVPIFCGGTGLYFKAYLEGFGDAPAADPKLRAELEVVPLPELLRELQQRDLATYERIDQQNLRRVVRAIEVIRLTGKAFSAQRAAWRSESRITNHESRIFGLRRTPADLHARINARVDAMFARGLVEETRELLQRGLAQNKTAMQALGYRQVVQRLRGELSLEDTIELVKLRTRQFAKRQMTWFRRQFAVKWIPVGTANEGATSLADTIVRLSHPA